MSTIPMMVMTHGKPMVSAMDPPIDGPTPGRSKAHVAFISSVWLERHSDDITTVSYYLVCLFSLSQVKLS